MSMPQPIDVLIITAQKLEFEQVLLVDDGAIDDGWTEKERPFGLDVAFRTFRGASDALRVAVTRAADMGMVAASTAAIPLIERYRPRCIAMCGVCAGRPEKVELGDVIIADRLWTYDSGKKVVEIDASGGAVETFEGDVLTYNLMADWKQRAERFVVDRSWPWLETRPLPYIEQERWAMGLALEGRLSPQHPERQVRCPDWLTVITRLSDRGMFARRKLALTKKGEAHITREKALHPDGFPGAKPFAVHVGPIATGNKVIEDPTIWSQLSTSMRRVLGLEMEACAIGAIAGAQINRNIRAVVAKGVMDVANPDRDDRYKAFAARASAEVLVSFLRRHMPRGDRSGHAERIEPPVAIVRAATVYWRSRVERNVAALNDHFAGHAHILGIVREPPELVDVGVLSVPRELEIEATRIRATLSTNDQHAIMVGEPSWSASRVVLKYQTTDFATVQALRGKGGLPRVLSANGVIVSPEGRTLLLHVRGKESATYKCCLHTIGGAFMPEVGRRVGDSSLGHTLLREILEESKKRLEESDWPGVFVSETTTGFVQYVALGLTCSSLDRASTWEGTTYPIGFDAIAAELLEARQWVPSGKLHVLLWLAAGAPAFTNVRFCSQDAATLLRTVLLRSAKDYQYPVIQV